MTEPRRSPDHYHDATSLSTDAADAARDMRDRCADLLADIAQKYRSGGSISAACVLDAACERIRRLEPAYSVTGLEVRGG